MRSVATDHPLAPLTAEEISRAAEVLRREDTLTEDVRVHGMLLVEPPKSAVWDHDSAKGNGVALDRQVLVVLRDRVTKVNYEAVVSLADGRGELRSCRELRWMQPPMTGREVQEAEAVIKGDPDWQAAMRLRGVEEFELAVIDPWAPGYHGPQDHPDNGRFAIGLTWMRTRPEDSCYARPVENLLVRLDLDAMKVVEVEDHGVVPLPPMRGNYGADELDDPGNIPYLPEGVRQDLKPLDIVEPEGTSFKVTGNLVEWQKWRFRIGFTQREGLVLQAVSYDDRGRRRPVLHRASISEIFNPYGDPSPTHFRKNAFDAGEYWLGTCTDSLELGCDCLGEIRYFDGVVADDDGEPITIPNAVCMHEEDSGLLWKHFEVRSGRAEVRRSRRLVVSSICTISNYDYGFYWYLYQDGGIEFEVKLTGIISNGAVPEGQRPTHGTLVAPGLYGPNHQHFFSLRLDMTVDGLENAVEEVNAVPDPPGPGNPAGSAWRAVATSLLTESEAQRSVDPFPGRFWKIVNRRVRNGLGEPVAYKLVPGENSGSYFHPGSHGLQAGGFVTSHFWATPFDPDELYAAGPYPNQHPAPAGLAEYAKAGRSLEDADVVVWYTFGVQHVVRPEDWPVMPVTRAGFHLKPSGFFDYNPAVDVPPPAACHPAGHDGH
ncbi:primary-amine oxidase [Candidatus Nephthysia bennettiae]|uniref:Amine oxidase n=1 Tax=Candidatus Nephthysia bennettiae TaxID=3127016 RepID=A0A934KA97_9BACT|nr:primary-amine oxidase [Candidatus Dormibacteraeota bacterium]MBJ7612734.1 primary-amine oxidase [Candidatus Dormibacteraeota bacterium]